MLKEKEPSSISIEDKFNQQIDQRYALWVSIIDDSEVREETKDKIRAALQSFKQGVFNKKWISIDAAFHGTISSILSIADQDDNKKEARALFENIRDDIWALFTEIKS